MIREQPPASTLSWFGLTPDDVPPARTPVLLKLKVLPIPLPRVRQDAVKDAEESKRALVQRGVFYGYVTAVLDFNLDGFGRQVPACFRVLTPAWESNCMTVERTSITFDKVEAWAVL